MDAARELLEAYGLDGLFEATTILLNSVLKVERSRHLQAASYERTDGWRGYASGVKAKTVKNQLGELHLQVPKLAKAIPAQPA